MIIKELRYTESQIFSKININEVHRQQTIKIVDYSLRKIYREIIYKLKENDINLFTTSVFILADNEQLSSVIKYIEPIVSSTDNICMIISKHNLSNLLLLSDMSIHRLFFNGYYMYILHTKNGMYISDKLCELEYGGRLYKKPHNIDLMEEEKKDFVITKPMVTKSKKKIHTIDILLSIAFIILVLCIIFMLQQPFINEYLDTFIP